jgi:5-methylcytosine-specific restriction protein A
MVSYRLRSRAVHLYVLRRADGYCEGCECEAPFERAKGDPYLEPHHTTRLADEGADDPREVIALCPNCHSRVHHSQDRVAFNQALIRKLRKIERAPF